MKKIVTVMAGSMIGVVVLGGLGFANHVEPAKGNKVSFALVNAFFECTSPNTATQSNGTPACTPPTADAGCTFTSAGFGTLTLSKIGSAAKGNQDLKIAVTATGLDVSCEGLPLHVELSYRLTTDDCPEGSCTAVDAVDFRTNAFCTVTNGRCKIKTTLNTTDPGLIATMGRTLGSKSLGAGWRQPRRSSLRDFAAALC